MKNYLNLHVNWNLNFLSKNQSLLKNKKLKSFHILEKKKYNKNPLKFYCD